MGNDSEVLEMVKEALEKGRVKVYYQPQFNAKTCDLVSVEALCRIENEYRELILPGNYIPVMERQENPEIITNFDWCIISKVCRFLSGIRSRGLKMLPVYVNLSRRHLVTEPSELYLTNMAKLFDIPHKYIGVEITESSSEDDALELQRLIYKLRTQGFRVAIDDFGAGQSNFQFLINNKADAIKLDRSFISHGCEDPREREVLKDVIYMARNLGLTVIAEGVEEARQWNCLGSMGCDLIQGYFAAEPLSEKEFIDYYQIISEEI